MRRSTFWCATSGLWAAFVLAFILLEASLGRASTLLLYPAFFWAMGALFGKRLHDRDKSMAWLLLLLLLPLLGPLWIAIELGLLKGSRGTNRYGPDPRGALDYPAVP